MQDLTMLPPPSTMTFPSPIGGASLLLAFRSRQQQEMKQRVLVIGSGQLAASRIFAALEAEFDVVVLAKGGLDNACAEVKWRVEKKECGFVDWDSIDIPHSLPLIQGEKMEEDAERLEVFLSTNNTNPFSLACITDTIIGSHSPTHHRRPFSSASALYNTLKSHHIHVNTADIPDLCDFTFLSTQRLGLDNQGVPSPSPLQVGVTTNGQGCRLASRIRRDIVAKLPKDVGKAASNLGKLRQLAKEASETSSSSFSSSSYSSTSLRLREEEDDLPTDELNEDSGLSTPNRPVPIRTRGSTAKTQTQTEIETETETRVEGIKRRMKWVAQVSEYWPISRIASMEREDMDQVLKGEGGPSLSLSLSSSTPRPTPTATDPLLEPSSTSSSRHALPLSKPGKILLVGSGPGHPSLLTLATHNALTTQADLVLSDKLVPDAVLQLIPKNVEVKIARKFPGNADGAQDELMKLAVEGARMGKCVVRLKQGDPVIYGRAGEEVLYFRSQGFEPLIIPGVSSAIAAPTFANIPITQRGVAESFVVCTGVGRKGKDVRLPGYERGRTVCLLMGVARLKSVVDGLVASPSSSLSSSKRDGAPYPKHTPIAIIERASMPDQRVLTSTLEHIVEALESLGEQRPPGMMVIGWSVLALWGEGDVTVLDDATGEEGDEEKGDSVDKKDEERVKKWLDGKTWRVREGIEDVWDTLQ